MQKYHKNTYECIGVHLTMSNSKTVCFRIKFNLKDAYIFDELRKIRDYINILLQCIILLLIFY